MSTDAIPIAAVDSERCLIATLLHDGGKTTPLLFGEVDERDFFCNHHRAVFAACVRMRARKEPVDHVLVAAELEIIGRIGEVTHKYQGVEIHGAIAVEAMALSAYDSPAAAIGHARRIRSRAQLRRLVTELTYGLTEARRAEFDPAILMGDLMAYLRQEAAFSTAAPDRMHEGVIGLGSHYAAQAASPLAVVKTGIDAIDKQCQSGGLTPGLTIVAARPGVGKTSLASTIAVNVGMRSKVLFIQAEMEGWKINERLLSIMMDRPIREMWRNDRKQWVNLAATADMLGIRLVVDRPRPTLAQIAGHAHRLHATEGLQLLIVDQLSKIERDGHKQQAMREHEWFGFCGDTLRALGIDLGIPVTLLHQINRASKEARRPSMHNLKGCGKLEEDADMVILLDRDNAAEQQARDSRDGGPSGETLPPDRAWLAVAKNRDGYTGDSVVSFDALVGRVKDLPTGTKPYSVPADRTEQKYDPRGEESWTDPTPF